MTPSIHIRLLAAASLVLAAFLGFGGLALDRAFNQSVYQAAEARLLANIYALLGAADTDQAGRMRLPAELPDPRLSNPDSGFYAQVDGERGGYHWNSPSLVGREITLLENTPPGEPRFSRLQRGEDHLFLLNFSLLWEDDEGHELSYRFAVAEESGPARDEVAAFRRTLLVWLGGAAVLLLLAQGALLRWGLRPLRQVAEDLKQIESGRVEMLQQAYPRELQVLTGNINAFIRTGRASRDRYRNSLGDLAHSLKTPLAVLQGATDADDPVVLKDAVREQIPRMNDIIQYQLRRAAASGRETLLKRCPIAPVAERLVRTLDKVYRDKGIVCRSLVDEQAYFPGDEGDLMEILGNLLENAYKYGSSRVELRAEMVESGAQEAGSSGGGGQCLLLEVGDDGPGIPEETWDQVLRRGVRADQRTQGQGIGLAVAEEIVRLYGGSLALVDGEAGGAHIRLNLPA